MIINCRYGLRITPDADTLHITYNNNFFYSNAQYQIAAFYTSDGRGVKQSNDIMSTTPKTNNPLFASYDVDQFDFSAVTPPLDISAMPLTIITAEQYNFSLLPGSPALRKGEADIFAAQKVVPQGGLYGATTDAPGVDMGAYQSDGSGNKHYASSLSFK
jgi:hypothetical protein